MSKTIADLHGPATLSAPDHSKHTIINVQEFVEEHWELFDDDEDVKHRKCPEHEDGRKQGGYWTRADRQLRRLIAGEVDEWKGWTRA